MSGGRFMPTWQRVIVAMVVTLGCVLFLLPLWWTIVWSTWHTGQIFSFPPKFVPGTYLLDNLRKLQEQIGIARVFLNSVIITSVSVLGALVFCSLAGFAFAKYRFRFREPLFYLLLATLAIPGQITSIPLFVLMVRMGWVNTYQGAILPGLVPAFGVFLMRQSAEEAIPDELIEAARLDGANELRIFFNIALPNILPHMAALSIFIFAGSWSALFWPIIILRSSDMFTLPVALASLIGSYEQPYDLLMAGSLLALIPPLILFLFLQRFFVKSLIAGAFK